MCSTPSTRTTSLSSGAMPIQVKVDQEYEADENGEASLLDTESLQLDTPEDVWLL